MLPVNLDQPAGQLEIWSSTLHGLFLHLEHRTFNTAHFKVSCISCKSVRTLWTQRSSNEPQWYLCVCVCFLPCSNSWLSQWVPLHRCSWGSRCWPRSVRTLLWLWSFQTDGGTPSKHLTSNHFLQQDELCELSLLGPKVRWKLVIGTQNGELTMWPAAHNEWGEGSRRMCVSVREDPPPPVEPPELPHQECCQCQRTCRGEYEGVYLCLLQDGWPGIDRALRCTEWLSRYISRSLSRTEWQRTSSSAHTWHLRPSHKEDTCVHAQVWKNNQFSEKVVVLMLVKEVGSDKKAIWAGMDRKGLETVRARPPSDFDAV